MSNLVDTNITTAAQKHRRSHSNSFSTDREIRTKSVPWLELNERLIDPDDAPRPCPQCIITKERVLDVTYIKREGVAVVVPSPWVNETVNLNAARFWRSHGFELRTWWNCEDIEYGYIKEWVRMCDRPVRVGGKSMRYSAKAWLAWVSEKYEELYR